MQYCLRVEGFKGQDLVLKVRQGGILRYLYVLEEVTVFRHAGQSQADAESQLRGDFVILVVAEGQRVSAAHHDLVIEVLFFFPYCILRYSKSVKTPEGVLLGINVERITNFLLALLYALFYLKSEVFDFELFRTE